MHNLSLWKGQEYVGVGAGAYSYFNKKRYNNPENIELYIKNKFIWKIIKITQKTEINEFILLRLRLIYGIHINEFEDMFNQNFLKIFNTTIEKLIKQRSITYRNGTLKLTKKGIDLYNQVVMEFI